ELQSLIDMLLLLARTFLIFVLISPGSTLTELALIVSGTTACGFILRPVACWAIEPRLALRPSYVSRSAIANIYAFGSWFGLVSLTRAVSPHIVIFVIGHALGSQAVTIFTIPRLLVSYTNWVLVSATQVAAPRAAVFHFSGQQSQQQLLFIEGGKYCMA